VNELNVVRAAVYLLRSCHKTPSATRVIELVRTARGGEGLRKSVVCSLIRQVLAEDGNRSGTVPELSGTAREPILSTSGTVAELSGTAPEHHARGKTVDIQDIDSRNAAAAHVRETEGTVLELATWFYREAVIAGARAKHEIRHVPERALNSLGAAAALLRVYERDVIEAQARRMFVRANTAGRDHWHNVTLEALHEYWDAFDADRMPRAKHSPVGAGARRTTPDDDPISAQLNAMVR
jgi:hypothetical protein